MAARVTDWLVAGDLRRLAAFGAGLGSLTVGAGLGFVGGGTRQSKTQYSMRSCAVQAQDVDHSDYHALSFQTHRPFC